MLKIIKGYGELVSPFYTKKYYKELTKMAREIKRDIAKRKIEGLDMKDKEVRIFLDIELQDRE